MKQPFDGCLRASMVTALLGVATLAVASAGCWSGGQADHGGSGGADRGGGGADAGGASGGTTSTGGATAGQGSGGTAIGSGGTTSTGGASPGSGGTPVGSGGSTTSATGGSDGKPVGGNGGGGKTTSSGGAGGTDANDPLNKRVTCTSGKRSRGIANEYMAPGRPCLDCHAGFAVAGTVFPTGHEADDCQGVNDETIMIVVTDPTGESVSLPLNSVGNFAAYGELPTPFTAKIVRGTAERRMLTPQTNPNCNDCHTVEGKEGAPGRIVPPF